MKAQTNGRKPGSGLYAMAQSTAIEHNLELRLFGSFSLAIGGRPLPPLRTKKGQWLLAILALQYGKPVDRSWLAGMLWPDSLEEQSLCNLRRALTDLRSALGAASDRICAPTPRTLSLTLHSEDMADVYLFKQLSELTETSALEQASALYTGHLLEGCDEHWVSEQRRSLELSYLSVKETLATRQGYQGSRVIQPLSAQGNSPHDNGGTGRLPRPLSTLIGRASEIASLGDALIDNRLVTLIGTGGIGKTRLAIHAAENANEQFANGAWFADLSGIRDPDTLTSFIASELNIPEDASDSAFERLTAHLNQKEILLVLDNCEHLIADCAHLADDLLNACPHLKILATSREPLGIHGEYRWSVPILSTPTLQLEVAVRLSPAEALTYDSVRMFVERGKGILPDFALTAGNTASVVEICVRLDGIPLSIELAAARLSVLTPDQIVERLKDRFRLLTGGSRTSWPRHQTLQATIEWSHDLLSVTEQTLFRRLSIYSGGWTVEDLKCVSYGEEDQTDQLDIFASLLEKSLVQADAEVQGERRYRLLESIREFALNKLKAAGEWNLACSNHAAYFLSVGEAANSHLLSVDRDTFIRILVNEHDNLRSALGWAICTPGEAVTAARIAVSLNKFWYLQCLYREGLNWIEQVLELDAEIEPAILCKVFNAAGSMCWTMGQYDAAQAFYERHRTISSELGDELGRSYALMNLGLVAMHRGEYMLARSNMEESVTLIRLHGDSKLLASPLHNLAIVAKDMGEFDYAFRLLEESYALNIEHNNRRGLSATLILRANLERRRGKFGAARATMLEVLALNSEYCDRHTVSITLHNLGDLSLHEGDLVAARKHYSECLEIAYELADRRQIATTLCSLGQLNRTEGNSAEYRSLYRQSADLALEMKERVLILVMLTDLAAQAEISGDLHAIPRIAGVIDSAFEEYGTPLTSAQNTELLRLAAFARRQLGEDSYCAAFAEGKSTSLDTALNAALDI